MADESNLVLKYFDLLDEFVRVRLLQDFEFADRIDAPLLNKSQYRQAIIQSSLPDFFPDISGKLKILEEEYDPLTIEDLLYQICIDVNPCLEIHQVSLPTSPDSDEEANEGSSTEGFSPLPRNIQILDRTLRKRVVGQDEAVCLLSRAMQKASIGLKRPNSPIGTFLLVGRTGTGKTEIAKALSEALYQEPGRLIRIDCSEYALPHEYSKLIGSPPGYIGHSEGGYLTEAVKSKKNCVVLFDEVEKAHDKVHNLLLQILDEGILTDSKGETVDFTQTIILLTSNLGVDEIDQIRGRMGFDRERRQSLHDIDHKQLTLESLKTNFRPEFLNRIDETIVFNPLDVEICTRIAGRMLKTIADLLGPRGFKIRFSSGLKRYLAKAGFSEEYGARELKRLIKREVEDLLAEKILDGELRPGSVFMRMRGRKVMIANEPTKAQVAV
jgi:ATP-dependent Clp protease ATP-binding subunit ClpA